MPCSARQLGRLYLDLAEWVYRNDEWVARYEVVPPDDEKAVAARSHASSRPFVVCWAETPAIQIRISACIGMSLRVGVSEVAQRLAVPCGASPRRSSIAVISMVRRARQSLSRRH